MNNEKIGKIIKENRIKNNLTQADLASKLGVTYQAVSKWENGKNIPDISLLKEISKLFNIDINDLIEGNTKPKNNKKIIIIISILVILLITSILIIILNRKKDNNFSMREIKSTCEYYDINGVVAYSKSKSSIYISNINYCGKKDETVYKKISCNLYEELNDKTTKIKSCDIAYDSTLEDYLKDIKINVDNYKSMCNKFSTAKLYLEIETDKGEGINTHKIPLELDDDCN